MEILYLWIKRFNNIINQEFLFASDYNIKFDRDTNKLDISLIESKRVRLFNEAFLNVTAIIGKNGSGKSSLLSFIKTVFSNSFYYYNDYVLVLKSPDNNILVIDKVSKGEESVIENKKLNDDINLTVRKDNEILFDNISLIIHSNSFSVYERMPLGSRYLDISFNSSLDLRSIKSNKLLIERYEELNNYYKDKPDKKDDFEKSRNVIINNTLPRDFLYHYDLQANINFLSEYKNEDWDFIPDSLGISFNPLFFDNNKDYFKLIGLAEKLQDIKYLIFEKSADPLKPESALELFKNKLVIYLFLFYTIHDQYYHPRNTGLKLVIEELKNKGNLDNIPILIKRFILDSTITLSLKNPLVKIRELVSKIDSLFNSFENFRQLSLNGYSFPIIDGVCNTLKSLFDIWLDNDFIFSFSWLDLSAGEAAFLTIFSRIKSIADFQYYKDTILILIDEGDLYLHPEWQRTFFSELNEFLPKFFKEKKIQLLLTSHSPILTSDFPKENLIFLNKVEGLCQVVNKDNFNNTFGANIHSLLISPFYLDKGFIGEFAKKTIQQIIDDLGKKEELSAARIHDIEWIIKIIGESLIKDRLAIIFASKYKTKENIEKEIFELQKELERRK
jgi:predicted ATP-binding protein involved in virulence